MAKEPTISIVLFRIREERFARLLLTLNSNISWLNKKDISVPYNGIPLILGITETERHLFKAKYLNQESNNISSSTATMN